MSKVYQYAEYPTSSLNFGCSSYKYSEVKDFIKPECVSFIESQFNNYYVPCSYVDIAAYMDYHELQGAIESAEGVALNVRSHPERTSLGGAAWRVDRKQG